MLKYRNKYSWLANEEIVLLINHYIRNADHRYIVTKRLVFQTTYEKLSEETEKYCSHPFGSKVDNLGFQMESCCCSLKQLIKDNQIADLQSQLAQASNASINAAQSQYILSQMGHWTPNTNGTTGA